MPLTSDFTTVGQVYLGVKKKAKPYSEVRIKVTLTLSLLFVLRKYLKKIFVMITYEFTCNSAIDKKCVKFSSSKNENSHLPSCLFYDSVLVPV